MSSREPQAGLPGAPGFGEPLPEFRVERLDGGHLDAAALRGRPALLIFLRHLR